MSRRQKPREVHIADSGEKIAKVVQDLKMGRFRFRNTNPEGREDTVKETLKLMLGLLQHSPVIDATRIYEQITASPKSIDIYGDHVMLPPWESSTICYVNEHGNVVCMRCIATDITKFDEQWRQWDSENDIDWDRVKYLYVITVWVGGRGGDGVSVQTTGPLHMWEVAVYPDGEMADFHWVQLEPKLPMTQWDMAGLVALGAINFLNCVNVELVEPKRSRPEQRRIERTGVRVSEIHVRPISKSYSGMGAAARFPPCVPLHSVRGHFARYGPEYGRKLLFGKYSGRFWIPAHARGSAEAGTTEQTHVIES